MSALPIDRLETPRFCGVPTFMRPPLATALVAATVLAEFLALRAETRS